MRRLPNEGVGDNKESELEFGELAAARLDQEHPLDWYECFVREANFFLGNKPSFLLPLGKNGQFLPYPSEKSTRLKGAHWLTTSQKHCHPLGPGGGGLDIKWNGA